MNAHARVTWRDVPPFHADDCFRVSTSVVMRLEPISFALDPVSLRLARWQIFARATCRLQAMCSFGRSFSFWPAFQYISHTNKPLLSFFSTHVHVRHWQALPRNVYFATCSNDMIGPLQCQCIDASISKFLNHIEVVCFFSWPWASCAFWKVVTLRALFGVCGIHRIGS